MKQKPPYNIHVYNRADGSTTFGEYIRAKRHVFYTITTKEDQQLAAINLAAKIIDFGIANKRQIVFRGDPLPKHLRDLLDKMPELKGVVIY